jgi:hypothetical protein
MWEFRSFEELDGRRAEAITLANNLRPLIKPSQPVLYHGTRYAQKILRSNELRWPDVGLSAVHFSRQLHTSAYWALLPRDDDEGKGAVFVLDRDWLAQKYKLETRRDGWLDIRSLYPPMYTEAEEIVWGRDIGNLHKYLIDTIWIDESTLTGQTTKQLREAAHLRLPKRRRAVLKPRAPAVPQQEWSEPLAMAA